MSHTDRRKKRLPLSFSLLYALPVFAAGAPVLAQAATAASATTSSSGNASGTTSAKKVTAAKTKAARTITQSSRDAAEGAMENVVVTGSSLKTAKNQVANPVQTITAREITQTGATSLGDFFQRMPSMGSGGTYNSQPNGGGGASCVDLRNLGSNRTLVLIDGKRTTMNAGNACIDMNTIPVQAVQSVEILKDGGSEIYGADAVSGVINIKLRHNMNDANVTVQGDISQIGDGKTGLISGYKGFNFDHDKGNITIFAQYQSDQGVMQKDREWATNVAQGNFVGRNSYGSSISPAGNLMTADGNYQWSTSNNGQDFHNYTGDDRYNFAKHQSLMNSWTDATANGDFHYDFNKHFQVYAHALYAHRTSSTFMAGIPTTGSVAPSTLPSALLIPANDPMNPTVTGASGLYNGDAQDVIMYRRLTELGDRRTETATDTVTGIFGLQGEITHNWMYDVSYTYGTNHVATTGEHMGNYSHLLNTLGIQQLDPSDASSPLTYNPAVCQSSQGCVLSSNPFAQLTPEQRKYVDYNTHDNADYQMRDLNVRIRNDKVVAMPYKNGGNLSLGLGMEHRSEQLDYKPDPVAAAGMSMTNTAQYTGGGFSVSEAYLEGQLQLLHDAPFAKDLTVSAQGRYSSYSTFGDAKNWKAMINWAPTRDIRFRATLGSSFRQPSVYELYGGQSLSYLGGSDPCAGATSPVVVANCQKAGVTNPATFQDANSGQIPTLVGGNAHLKPETGKTYTFGTVLTPRWFPGLTASVEYWHYTLKNMITALEPQYIANKCYQGTGSSYCNSINRSGLTQQIVDVDSMDINSGGLKTSGIDFDLTYRLRLSVLDTLTLNNNYQQLVSYLQQNEPGGEWYNQAGRLDINNGTGQPRVRDYATVTWQHGSFGLTYMMQYTGGSLWNDGQTDIRTYNMQSIAAGNGAVYGRVKTPGIFSHDLSVSYRYDRWQFAAGVNNLLDKKPPYVVDGATNSSNGVYGGLYEGRYAWVRVGANF